MVVEELMDQKIMNQEHLEPEAESRKQIQKLETGEDDTRIPPSPPGFERTGKNQLPRQSLHTTDIRTGSIICGFVDAECDARINTLNNVPFSPQNDVAMGLPMVRRDGVPEVPGSSSSGPSTPPPPSNGLSTPNDLVASRTFLVIIRLSRGVLMQGQLEKEAKRFEFLMIDHL
ncbi:hypothetical protein D8674_005665 [Pyrus ussuriensis x Pyrus communis]|uniref:Uncharacterized protein n=1 Tax=Pyrus ussuriensis x Pyrus communis TaxID=2448454 RepID=A0A5N5FS31_9ROSA|nr:hypothetical protein D8674_005665 [Pyrus ussuriensis x Pyrus communis]